MYTYIVIYIYTYKYMLLENIWLDYNCNDHFTNLKLLKNVDFPLLPFAVMPSDDILTKDMASNMFEFTQSL